MHSSSIPASLSCHEMMLATSVLMFVFAGPLAPPTLPPPLRTGPSVLGSTEPGRTEVLPCTHAVPYVESICGSPGPASGVFESTASPRGPAARSGAVPLAARAAAAAAASSETGSSGMLAELRIMGGRWPSPLLPGEREPLPLPLGEREVSYAASARSFSTRLNFRAIASGQRGSAFALYVGMPSFAVDDCHDVSCTCVAACERARFIERTRRAAAFEPFGPAPVPYGPGRVVDTPGRTHACDGGSRRGGVRECRSAEYLQRRQRRRHGTRYLA